MKVLLSIIAVLLICSTILLVKDNSSYIQKGKKNSEKKIPLYISIETDRQNSKQTILDFINQNIKTLKSNFSKENQEIIDDDITKINEVFRTDQKQGKWKYPQTWHTTILYLGGKSDKIDNPLYTGFEEGKQVDLNSETFVYLPGKIMCSTVFPKNQDVDNKVPHVTIMQAAWRPVQCNDVLESVFINNDAPFQKEYQQLENNEDLQIMQYVDINIYGKQEKAYVINGVSEFFLEGINEAIY